MSHTLLKKIFLLSFLLLLPTGYAGANENLELWLHPYLPATKLIKNFSPLTAYLSNKIGQPIQIRVSKDYKSHNQRVGEGRIDLAYLGPAPYVQITRVYGKQTILAGLQVNGSPLFHGMIITRQGSSIKTIKDLIGKKFAFGDPNSTMSHLIPRFMLFEKGVPVNKLQQYEFLGSHNNVALGVLGGYYDAGAVKEGIYDEYKARGLNILAKSPPIPAHLFVSSNHLPEETITTLRQLLLNLKDPTILTSIKKSATGMVLVKDTNYKQLRIILNQQTKL